MSYVCILLGDGEHCELFFSTALTFTEAQSNMLEKCWLNMNKAGVHKWGGAVGSQGFLGKVFVSICNKPSSTLGVTLHSGITPSKDRGTI